MSNKVIYIILLVISLLVCVGLWWVHSVASAGGVKTESNIYVTSENNSYEELVESLRSKKTLKNIKKFEIVAKILGIKDDKIRNGHYRLRKGMSYREIINIFKGGLQTPVRATFNNVRTLPLLAKRLSQQLESDSTSFADVLLSKAQAAQYGYTQEQFIALFIPNTYEMYWTITPEDFVAKMSSEHSKFWNEEREEKRERLNMSQTEVATLASIVYEETKMTDEMATVAGVYINRLNMRWKLEADPTVKFAVGDISLRRILYVHLEVDSPYNTYKHAGLPPGPICMPSIAAIDAVLDYQRHEYMFFVAKEDFSGYHNFGRTLAEHNRNKQRWVDALNNAGIR